MCLFFSLVFLVTLILGVCIFNSFLGDQIIMTSHVWKENSRSSSVTFYGDVE